ncbi:PDZ domain-containing protein [bacterium]|nr:PDZ domain-containing protein [bacterium]
MTFNLPERYIYLINALIVAAIAWFAALSVSDAVRLHFAGGEAALPEQTDQAQHLPPGMFRSAALYEPIVRRDIFNLEPAPAAAPPTTTTNENLSITLLGTSHLSGGIKPFAIVEDAAGNQTLYRLGETIPDAGRLIQIDRDRIVVLHEGKRVAVQIPADELGDSLGSQPANGLDRFKRFHNRQFPFLRGPIRRRPSVGEVHKLGPNHYAISRSTVNDNVSHMAQLFTEMRATPNFENGKSNGFLLSEIQPGSIFQQIGLHNGDVLTDVSGHPISDPAKAMQLLSTLDKQSSITLTVIRDGAPMRLSYSIH